MNRSIFTLEKLSAMLFFLCLNFATVLGLSQFNIDGSGQSMIRILILGSAVALIFNYVQVRKIRINALFLIAVFLILAILSYVETHNFNILMLVMVFMIAKKLSLEELLKYNLITLLVAFCSIISTSLLGITDMTFHDVLKNNVMFTVYRLGFNNPNSPPIVIFAMVTGYNLLRNFRLTKKEFILEILIAYLVFSIFGSRACTLVLLIYVIVVYLVKKIFSFKVTKYIMAPWQYFIILGTFLMLYISYKYSEIDTTWYNIDVLLSGRLYTWKNIITFYGVHLFGTDMSSLSEGLDNGYLYLLMYSGVVLLLLYNYIFVYVSKFAYKHAQWGLLITAVSYEVYAFFESVPLSSGLCNILLVFGYLIISDKQLSNKK